MIVIQAFIRGLESVGCVGGVDCRNCQGQLYILRIACSSDRTDCPGIAHCVDCVDVLHFSNLVDRSDCLDRRDC